MKKTSAKVSEIYFCSKIKEIFSKNCKKFYKIILHKKLRGKQKNFDKNFVKYFSGKTKETFLKKIFVKYFTPKIKKQKCL